MFSMVFGELYLPISLRGEILVAKKKRYWRIAGEEKVAYLPQYDNFMG
jgi:hypothetical protein